MGSGLVPLGLCVCVWGGPVCADAQGGASGGSTQKDGRGTSSLAAHPQRGRGGPVITHPPARPSTHPPSTPHPPAQAGTACAPARCVRGAAAQTSRCGGLHTSSSSSGAKRACACLCDYHYVCTCIVKGQPQLALASPMTVTQPAGWFATHGRCTCACRSATPGARPGLAGARAVPAVRRARRLLACQEAQRDAAEEEGVQEE